MATQRRKPSGRTTSGKRNSKKQNTSGNFAWKSELALLAVLAASIIIFISNIGQGGMIGGRFSAFFFGLFGIIAYAFPFWLFFFAAFLVSNKDSSGVDRARIWIKALSSVLLLLFLSMFAHLIFYGGSQVALADAFRESAHAKSGGGALGGLLGTTLSKSFGIAGAYVIDIAVIAGSIALLTEQAFFHSIGNHTKKAYSNAKEDAAIRREISEGRQAERREEKKERLQRRMDRKVTGVSSNTSIKGLAKEKSDKLSEIQIQKEEAKTADAEKGHGTFPFVHVRPAGHPYPNPTEAAAEEKPEALEDQQEQQPVIHMPDEAEAVTLVAESESMPKTKRKTKHSEDSGGEDPVEILEEIHGSNDSPGRTYVYPIPSLLKIGSARSSGDSRQHLKAMSDKLQQTLTNFGVDARVTDVTCGPAVTRYEIQPEMGVKVSKILGLSDDIKLNLAVPDIRIEAPIPGKAAIGIEVPNKENVTVTFRELIESPSFQKHDSKLAFCAGKDISGNVIIADIAKMPHLLIAGATGSGKSVCINTIIMSILFKATPDEVRMIMIDPKVVELSVYNGIPHLMIPVVTDPKKAAGALHWAVAEMTERYQKFAEYHVRDINSYNKKVDSILHIEDEDKPKKMPQILIIVDELADLMMVAPGDVEDAICRLAQLARAAGIHLVIATQRPSVNVITGLIKANMPSRIAFSVTSGVDSRTILDMNGAEKLLGKGDMLFYPQGFQKPLRVQGSFVSDKEVGDVTAFVSEQNGEASYQTEVEEKVRQVSESSMGGGSGFTASDDDRDVYFAEAGKFIIEKEKGSIGMLQRMFKVGFNRAARIMDQLEEAGVVGPEEGTKPRRVLMTEEEFESLVSEHDNSMF